MPCLWACIAVALSATWPALASIITIKATNHSAFDPDTVTARHGDILEFHFMAGNHSVVAGDYENPCSPMPLGDGFFSGFVPVSRGESVGRLTRGGG